MPDKYEMVNPNTSGQPTPSGGAFKWVAVQMVFFDDGTLVGQVVVEGTEQEMDDWARKFCGNGPREVKMDIPKSWAHKRVVDNYLQVIALSKKSTVICVNIEGTGISYGRN